ncbi:hypothetical protein BJX66DRAFT_332101 [Aspergillus keveii]|uniref:F-box domain-containing protein n=1 Tax=Aspergillus keveii TaxID=714993 RepID=A0ABR4GNE2_9EURO
MRKQTKKKHATIHEGLPKSLQDATDTQLLKTLSKPQRSPWPERKTKPRPRSLRITPKRRYRAPEAASSSFFDILPLELLDMILVQLDYISLTRLSATNTKAERFIKTRTYYRLVVENCYMFLAELRRIQLLSIPSAASIYHALCKPICSTPDCQRLAGFFFLLTCRRYCYQCLGTTPQTTALCTIMVEEKYHIARDDILANLLCLRSSERPRSLFVLEADVHSLAARLFGEERRIHCLDRWWTMELTSLPLPFVDEETKQVEQGRLCRACNTALEDHSRLWQQMEIQPTKDEWDAWERRREKMEEPAYKVHGTKQLLQHIRSGECPHAQGFWLQEARKR